MNINKRKFDSKVNNLKRNEIEILNEKLKKCNNISKKYSLNAFEALYKCYQIDKKLEEYINDDELSKLYLNYLNLLKDIKFEFSEEKNNIENNYSILSFDEITKEIISFGMIK